MSIRQANRPAAVIVVPALSHVGGVSNFYLNLRDYLPAGDVSYFEYRSSRDQAGVLSLIGNYLKFIGQLCAKEVTVVCVNPSMGRAALVRDGLYSIFARIFQKRLVVFFHGWNPDTVRTVERGWRWLFRGVFFRAASIIVLSPEYELKIRKWGYKGEINVLTTHVPESYVGIKDLSGYSSGQRTDEFKILFLARVEKKKGISEALSAFALIKNKYPFVSMECIGGGDELTYWKSYASDRGIPAIFVGEVFGERKLDYFMKADCYLFPSHSEGMPTSLLEAMAVGLPVVSHAVGGLKFMFQDGRMGYLIEGLEPASYARAIEDLIEDRSRISAMGKFNSEYIRAKCTSPNVAKDMMRIFFGDAQRRWGGPDECSESSSDQ